MEDFDALALVLSRAIGQLRACVILSRDGLVLGAHPANAEGEAKHAWIRLAALGELERGFVQFGTETWCYVRRGTYAAMAITSPSARPGLVIDQMEGALLEAEQARVARDGAYQPEPLSAPTSKPRSPLHPDLRPAERPLVVEHASPEAAPAEAEPITPDGGPAPARDRMALAGPPNPGMSSADPAGAGHRSASQAADSEPPGSSSGGAATAADPPGEASDIAGRPGGKDRGEVDPVTLAREFSALLQDDGNPADG